jgi:hypothetical protein
LLKISPKAVVVVVGVVLGLIAVLSGFTFAHRHTAPSPPPSLKAAPAPEAHPRAPVPPATPSPTVQSVINWSGYQWDVRGPDGNPSAPGPNFWDDSTNAVSVDSAGNLKLNIWYDGSQWRTAEVDETQPLGYGTYRWVVSTNLAGQDPWAVLGLFTYDGSATANAVHSENDIEFSRWGDPSASPLTFTVIPGASGQRQYVPNVGRDAPYTCTLTWQPGSVRFTVTGAGGKTIGDFTSTAGVPSPNSAVPVINWYLSEGHAPQTDAAQSVIIRSFSFTRS